MCIIHRGIIHEGFGIIQSDCVDIHLGWIMCVGYEVGVIQIQIVHVCDRGDGEGGIPCGVVRKAYRVSVPIMMSKDNRGMWGLGYVGWGCPCAGWFLRCCRWGGDTLFGRHGVGRNVGCCCPQ